MNKTAIKNFAVWARNKLIADISYKAGLLGITEKGIKSPLPQSTQTVQFFDIGTKEPSPVTGVEIQQRKRLVEEIERKAKQSDYGTAYKNVLDEVAYTWFNRLIAIRFMEVNDYLPTHIRVLSSESNGKAEPDLVTYALEASFDYSAYEKDRIIQLKQENKLDELFRMLFIKQCNALNTNLPELFEKTRDYTELLLNVSFTDKEGLVYHLVNAISDDDFNVSKEGQVEIIGWLYQYYNTEPKDETFALLKKNVKITKERIPAATQLFTPDWIVRYMVENSLGRLWLEGHPNEELKANWKYYLDEVAQEEGVQKQLNKIREEYKSIKPEDIKIIDPAMGSGHILIYAFDVLMKIYECYGYSQRDAAKSIVENNLYGLDIDNRAYQLAYFAVMMKARQYNRRVMNDGTKCNVYAIEESNEINRNHLIYFGTGLSEMENNTARLQILGLLDTFTNAKEYGSIIGVENYNWQLLRNFIQVIDADGQMSLDAIGVELTRNKLRLLIETGEVLARKYDIVATNPPYMGSSGMSAKLLDFVKKNYPDSKNDLFAVFIEKCGELLKSIGYQAMITQHAWMFLPSYEKLRGKLLQRYIVNMAHLGARAFDEISGEVVQTTAFVLSSHKTQSYIGTYSRLVGFGSQSEKEVAFLNREQLHHGTADNFAKIPGSPLVYWAGNSSLKCFDTFRSLENYGDARQGMATGNNEKFVRFWYEPIIDDISFYSHNHSEFVTTAKKYITYIKSSGLCRWYGNNYTIIRFDKTYYDLLSKSGNCLPSRQYYYRKNANWSLISTGRFGARFSEYGSSFDVGAHAFFGDDKLIYDVLGYLNSVVFSHFIIMLTPTLNYNSGMVQLAPYATIKSDGVKSIVENNIALSRAEWDSFETSWDFERHPLICGECSVASAFGKWEHKATERFNALKANEEELNRIFIDIYGLQDELTPEVEDKDVTVRRADLGREIRSLISYAVGCMFGRYSLDAEGIVYAGGDWNHENYRSYIPDKDNILPICDDEYFDNDIVERFVVFVKTAFGANTLEENLKFMASALGGKGTPHEVIRNYFMNEFYRDHCKIYQKRPIYWLFDSGKQNGFKALIYMHRYDENTIGNLRIDYLHRMQRIYENEIARMQDTIENSKNAREVTAATKRREKLIKQLQETKEYDEKIAHLALARTPIDLDDGVKVNYEKVQADRDGKKLDVLAKI